MHDVPSEVCKPESKDFCRSLVTVTFKAGVAFPVNICMFVHCKDLYM